MPSQAKKVPQKPAATKKQATSKSKTTNEPQQQQAQPSVDWPALDPLCPKEDLNIHHLVPNQIVTVSNFWTAALCKKYVAFLSGLPLSTTPGVPKKGEAVRVNDRFQVDDPSFAETLWSSTALRDLVTNIYSGDDEELGADMSESEKTRRRQQQLWGGEVVGLNPNIRIYRYRKGQFFDQHYDDSNMVSHPGPPQTPARTTWTLLLYLSSPATGCQGGETVFYPSSLPAASKSATKASNRQRQQQEPVVVSLETGMALLHRHGRECMLHEGREVTDGEKWVGGRSFLAIYGSMPFWLWIIEYFSSLPCIGIFKSRR